MRCSAEVQLGPLSWWQVYSGIRDEEFERLLHVVGIGLEDITVGLYEARDWELTVSFNTLPHRIVSKGHYHL
jgi:hypothetical protein